MRRLADWIEDLRYQLTVPAQSVFGQVGCLAGRTIAYRREAFEPAVRALVRQTVFGVPLHVGDDRVLTNELLRNGWRTVYQSTALVLTDAPPDWRTFWRQQLRWGRSSQRETLLSLRLAVAAAGVRDCFATDIVTPFALYGVMVVLGVARRPRAATARAPRYRWRPSSCSAIVGMVASIGIRQIPHFRRSPARPAPPAAVRAAADVRDGPDPDRSRSRRCSTSPGPRGPRSPRGVIHEAAVAESAHV